VADKSAQPLAGSRPYEAPYPLLLISPASDRRITSTFGGSGTSDDTPALEMHPDDARVRGLAPGTSVRVWNDLGEVHLPLEITDAVPAGVVSTWKGTWLRTSDNGQTVSALVPGHHADISGGACFNDTRGAVAAAPGLGRPRPAGPRRPEGSPGLLVGRHPRRRGVPPTLRLHLLPRAGGAAPRPGSRLPRRRRLPGRHRAWQPRVRAEVPD